MYVRNAAYADQDFRGDDNQMNLQVLRNEFEAGNGSFLITIRANMIWDVDAFDRLSNAMEQYCQEASGKSAQLERWLAQGFWYVPNFVRGWTSHPNFQRALPATYYESAYRQLDELAFWFFFGYCGDQNDPTCPAPVG